MIDFEEDSPDRHAFIEHELERLYKPPPKQQHKTDMSKHDAFFGVIPGCTIADIYRVTRPTVEAGDDARGPVGGDD